MKGIELINAAPPAAVVGVLIVVVVVIVVIDVATIDDPADTASPSPLSHGELA